MWIHPSNELIKKMAQSTYTILLTGRTGTGKSHLARDIHEQSKRAHRPFVAINLATLNDNLIESELFGHEKGAFSGAEQKRVGKLEAATGGTAFLDEIGELSLRLQTKLLDALHHKVICPVGSNREMRLDVRIVAATNRDLQQMVKEGTFREDLYYRLNTFQVHLPNLAEEPERLLSLVHDFLQQACCEQGQGQLRLSDCFLGAIREYSWPGNLRELKNAIDFSVAICSGDLVTRKQLPPYIQTKLQGTEGMSPECVSTYPTNYYQAKEIFERAYLNQVLRQFNGKVNRTARETKMSKVTLIEKIRRYEINLEGIKYENFSNLQ